MVSLCGEIKKNILSTSNKTEWPADVLKTTSREIMMPSNWKRECWHEMHAGEGNMRRARGHQKYPCTSVHARAASVQICTDRLIFARTCTDVHLFARTCTDVHHFARACSHITHRRLSHVLMLPKYLKRPICSQRHWVWGSIKAVWYCELQYTFYANILVQLLCNSALNLSSHLLLHSRFVFGSHLILVFQQISHGIWASRRRCVKACE